MLIRTLEAGKLVGLMQVPQPRAKYSHGGNCQLLLPIPHMAEEAIKESAIFHSIIRHLSHTFNNQRLEGLDFLNMEVIKVNW